MLKMGVGDAVDEKQMRLAKTLTSAVVSRFVPASSLWVNSEFLSSSSS